MKQINTLTLTFLLLTPLAALHTAGPPARGAVTPAYEKLWRDPAVNERIQNNIEKHRKGDATITVVGQDGRPVGEASLEIRQQTHEFLFGCNAFMADSFPNPEQNRRYEETFKGAFNFATAPFYWAALEPEEGKPRFEAGSPPIYRRPPPDVVVRFCQRNGIVIKGHTLLYHGEHLPTWLSGDRQEAAVQIRRHFEQIAQRYGKEVSVWDVVNEPLDSFRFDKGKALPQDYTYWAMKTAELLFPPNSVLMVNHNHPVWADALRLAEESHYYLLVHNLLLRNARVDAIGIQLHTGYGTDFEDMLAGKKWRPCDLLTVLDLFSRLQRPLHITEITFPTRPEGPQGEETQACVLRNLYRLWFSHRNVEAITYWDLVDGTTWQDAWHGGLLRKDLSPKPAYLALDKLINHEWKTNLKLTTDAQGQATFRGFYGKYQVKVVSSGKTQIFEINHRQRGPKDYRLSLKD